MTDVGLLRIVNVTSFSNAPVHLNLGLFWIALPGSGLVFESVSNSSNIKICFIFQVNYISQYENESRNK